MQLVLYTTNAKRLIEVYPHIVVGFYFVLLLVRLAIYCTVQ